MYALTNVTANPLIPVIVHIASERTNMRVFVLDGPMPNDNYGHCGYIDEDEFFCYDSSKLPKDEYMHICTLDPGKCHSEFWDEYDRLKGMYINRSIRQSAPKHFTNRQKLKWYVDTYRMMVSMSLNKGLRTKEYDSLKEKDINNIMYDILLNISIYEKLID